MSVFIDSHQPRQNSYPCIGLEMNGPDFLGDSSAVEILLCIVDWRKSIVIAVAADAIVEHINVIRDVLAGHFSAGVVFLSNAQPFPSLGKAFCNGIAGKHVHHMTAPSKRILRGVFWWCVRE